MLLLDTDILIDIQRGYNPATNWFASLPESPAIPGYVVMELIQGTSNAQELGSVKKLVSPLSIVWPTETDNALALTWFESFHLSHSLGLLDALIAGCAIGLSATLCTFNEKHYRIIPGIKSTQP